MIIAFLGAACQSELCYAQDQTRYAMITQRVINHGDSPIDDLELHCLLPTTNPYQDITDLSIHPKPVLSQTDAEGQKAVSFKLGSVPPGESRTVRIFTQVILKAVTVAASTRTPNVKPLDDLVRQGCLADAPPLQLEVIKPLAERLAADKEKDWDKGRAFYEYMIHHCRYDIDRKVQTANEVLNGEPASCSELALAYVALCRSAGIPARMVIAYTNRQDNAPSIDWRTHAWAEFFAEGIGWIPVDPTNKFNYPENDYFGRQDGRYLTIRDDGVPLPKTPDPSWYVVYCTTSSPRPQMEIGRTAVWNTPATIDNPTESFLQGCKALDNSDESVRLKAVHDWLTVSSPLNMGFLLEAMFDSSAAVRVAGLSAIGQSGHACVMIALMDLLDTERVPTVRQAILDAAGQLLKIKNEEQRIIAVGELAKSRHDEALKLLEDIGNDPAKRVRVIAAQMLYKFGDKPDVHKAYRQLVEDEDDLVRVMAALRWSRTGSKEGVGVVVDLLESNVRWDREHALTELKKYQQDTFRYDPHKTPKDQANINAVKKWRDWLQRQPDILRPAAPTGSSRPSLKDDN